MGLFRSRSLLVCLIAFSLNLFASQSSPSEQLNEGAAAPRAEQTSGTRGLPRVLRFSGALRNSANEPLTGAVGISFAIYDSAQGGVPLWIETQNAKSGQNTRNPGNRDEQHEDRAIRDRISRRHSVDKRSH